VTWVKLDDQFFLRPRCRRVGIEGRALYLAGCCYCSTNTTDGVIVSAAIPLVAAQAEVEPSVADSLLNVGLWATHVEGVEVVDYLKFNPSREKVEADRASARDRAARRSGEVPPKPDRSPVASSSVPTDPLKSSSSTDLVGARPDDDGIPETVWTEVAKRKYALQKPGTIRNASGWLRTATENSRSELGPRALELMANFDLSAGQLVDVLMSPTSPQWLGTCRKRSA
jgi:hypothetical protein